MSRNIDWQEEHHRGNPYPPMLTMSCVGQTPWGIVLLGTSPRISERTMSIRPAR